MPTRGSKGKSSSASKKKKAPAARKKAAGRSAVKKKTAKKKTAKKKVVSKKKTAPRKKKATGKKKAVAKKKGAPKKKAAKKKAAKKKAPKKKPAATAKARKTLRSIEGLLNSLGTSSSTAVNLYAEIETLGDFIHRAKGEIAALRPDVVKDEHLPKAGEELEAIVAATADATHKIMDAAEIIEDVMGVVDGDANAKLLNAVTQVYEACSFQDITGQRINKVVQTLGDIEGKVDDLIRAFGSEVEKIKSQTPQQRASQQGAAKKEITDQDLLEGPQLAGQGKSQAEIDALLASFD